MNRFSNRIEEFDIIKGILIICVILRHILPMAGISEYGSAILGIFQIFTEALLITFMLITGYCYKPKDGVLNDIKHRFKSIILPALKAVTLFSFIYLIKYVFIERQSLVFWFNNTLCNYLGYSTYNFFLQINENIMQYSMVAYWYLYQLFMAFILFIPVFRVIKDKDIKLKLLVCAVLFISSMLLHKWDPQGCLVTLFSSHWSYYTIIINIVGFAGVLLLGTILKEIRIFTLTDKPVRKWLTFIVTSLFFVYLCMIYETRYGFQYGKWGPYGMWSIPLTVIAGVCLFYSLYVIATYLKRCRFIDTVLSFVGRNSLYYLLLHVGICEIVAWTFGFWYNIYYVSGYPLELYSPWNGFIVTVLVFGIATLIIILGRKVYRKD